MSQASYHPIKIQTDITRVKVCKENNEQEKVHIFPSLTSSNRNKKAGSILDILIQALNPRIKIVDHQFSPGASHKFSGVAFCRMAKLGKYEGVMRKQKKPKNQQKLDG